MTAFWLRFTELVDIGPRPVVMALGSVANWGANFIVGASYTTLHNWLHEFIFIGFAVCTLLLTMFLAYVYDRFLVSIRVLNSEPWNFMRAKEGQMPRCARLERDALKNGIRIDASVEAKNIWY